MLQKLKDTFKDSKIAKAAIPVVAAFGITAASMPAHADEKCEQYEGLQNAVYKTEINMHGGEAIGWSGCHKDAIAIALALGTDPRNPSIERIQQVLEKDMKDIGVEKYMIFYSQNDVPATVGSVQRRGATVSDSPRGLGDLRAEVKEVAKNLVWEKNQLIKGAN